MEEPPDRLTNISDCVLLPINICGIQWRDLWKHLPTLLSTSSQPNRLNDLPDFILLHILSSLDIKQAIHTCILSKRWRNLWKNLPYLSLNPSCFTSFKYFAEFVSQILSLRDSSIALSSLKLDSTMLVEQHGLFEMILKYAVSHNVQHLKIVGNYDFELFRSCFASCHTLRSLSVFIIPPYKKVIFPNFLNLPALTSLHLSNVIFQNGDDPFSAYPKLNTLTISHFKILGEQNLSISSTTLLELTIESHYNHNKIKLFTPSLCTISLIGIPFQILYGSNLSSVKHIYIDTTDMCLINNFVKPLSDLLSWFLEHTNMTSLTVSICTLQILSLVPDLLKVQFPSLCNSELFELEMGQFIDTKLIGDYFLQNSPSAKLRFIRSIPKRNIGSLPDIILRRTRTGEGGSVRYFLLQDEQRTSRSQRNLI